MKEKIIKLTKSFLRKIGIIIILPKDTKLISDLKIKFFHNERSFVYGLTKRLVDTLYCHASPGVLESIINYFYNTHTKENIKHSKLLNLGGGSGQVSDIFRAIGFDVYNLDIEIKEESQKNIKFDLNSTSDLPFSFDYFDVVICSEIIEHIENPWKLFRGVKNVLKSGGVMVLTTPNVQSFFSRINFLFTGYLHWFSPKCFGYHINPVFKWEIDLISKKNNFVLISLFGNGEYFLGKKNKNHKKIIKKNDTLIFIFKKI